VALAVGLILIAGLATPGPTFSETAKVARCPATPAPPEVLTLLNAARRQGAICQRAGPMVVAAPVTWSDNLAAVAQAQSRDMAELKQMRHRDTLNRGLAERLSAMGYRFSTAVENIAVGYDSLDEVVEAWLDSEDHCENLMNAKVLELGLACSDDASAPEPGAGRYWTLVLGAPRRASR
jgi:uncharacterized protein YkwD